MRQLWRPAAFLLVLTVFIYNVSIVNAQSKPPVAITHISDTYTPLGEKVTFNFYVSDSAKRDIRAIDFTFGFDEKVYSYYDSFEGDLFFMTRSSYVGDGLVRFVDAYTGTDPLDYLKIGSLTVQTRKDAPLGTTHFTKALTVYLASGEAISVSDIGFDLVVVKQFVDPDGKPRLTGGDVAVVASMFGRQCSGCAADLTGDGEVDHGDLAYLRQEAERSGGFFK